MNTTKPVRKTLLQLQSEVTVKDPSSHAKSQVAELDKTAKKSLAKRKACNEQIADDKKEIGLLEIQIAQIHRQYDPLCESLKDAKERKKNLLKTLEQCSGEEKRMMSSMSNTVTVRKQEDSKLCRKMASEKLETERGFDLGPNSTFRQKHSLSSSK